MESIVVHTFGEFSISYGNKSLSEKTIRSKKVKILLAYLLSFRKKEITQLELIDALWRDDESDNPVSALKTLMHRTRTALSELGINGGIQLIKNANGTYYWNNDVDTIIDTECFDEYYKIINSSDVDNDKKLEISLKAISMYKGSYLCNFASEYWVMTVSTYYNTLYSDIIKTATQLLYKKNDYLKIVDICTNAISINPYDEPVYYDLIDSLYESGNSQAALEQYRKAEKFFYSNFGVSLSDRFSELFKKISNTKNNLEFNLDIIEEDLTEKDKAEGAYLCDYEFFRQQFQLEKRASQRKKTPLQICLVSITDTNGNIPPQQIMNTCMQQIEDSIRYSLRTNDIFSRYSVSQYIIMLVNTTFENAGIVIDRINSNCKRKVRLNGLKIECSIKNFSPEMEMAGLNK